MEPYKNISAARLVRQQLRTTHSQLAIMSKRTADLTQESAPLKAGERPVADAPPDEVGEFEDEFEDEFESEDEVLEAGVDGRPDAEREEEEKGMRLQVWYAHSTY